MADFNPEDMDRAAKQAEQELMKAYSELNSFSLENLAAWWAKWYLTAGHKRLGRILVNFNKARS